MSLAADVDLAIHQLRLREAKALSGGHWITVKSSAGATHLYISDGGAAGPSGTVLAGPSPLLHTNLANLPERHNVTHHPAGHTPDDASSQISYAEVEGPPKPAPKIRAEVGWDLHNKRMAASDPHAVALAKAGWVSTPEGEVAAHNAEFQRNYARRGRKYY